jgi:putative ABC transport system substrate-binding protein
MLNRRGFAAAAGLGLASLAVPGPARAQKVATIAILLALSADDPEGLEWTRTFQARMQELGWIEGRTCRYVVRWADARPDLMATLAQELAALAPDVILAVSSPVLAALQRVTTTIPIVFASVSDPVGAGFVRSLAEPGANTTCIATYESEIAGKWLQKLVGAAPEVSRIGVLLNADAAAHKVLWRDLERTARERGLPLVEVPFRTAQDIAPAIHAFARGAGDGLIVLANIIAVARRTTIVEMAADHRMPAIYPFRSFVGSGGLMSYGTDVNAAHRLAADYAAAVLKGIPPARLPVQLQTTFRLCFNQGTAAALGLAPSPIFLAEVDEMLG